MTTSTHATKHGVLHQGILTTLEREGTQWGVSHPLLTLPVSLSSLCSLALDKGLTHLWVYPDVCTPDEAFYQQARSQWDLFPSWVYPTDFPLEDGVTNELVSVTGFKLPKGGQARISVIFPLNTQWQWIDEQTSPKMLLQVIKYLETQLQVPVSGGATTVGMAYLEECNFNLEDRLEVPTVDLSALPFRESAQDVIWQQGDLKQVLYKGWFLHKLDKNSAYLRSCVEEKMGVGNPRLMSGDAYRDNFPGIWYCRVDGYMNARLPHPSWYPYGQESHWFATPMVKCLRKMGYTVHILRGYSYEECEPTLKKWAQYLWDIRSSFRNDTDKWKHPVARQKAALAIKDIYTSTLGLINSDIVKGTWKFRPDWHSQILAGVRATMFYNMTKFAESGYYPVIVYMDALFYITPHQDIEQDIPDILKHRNSLGGYKHEYALPVDEQVKNILMSSGNIAHKVGQLNKLAKGIN